MTHNKISRRSFLRLAAAAGGTAALAACAPKTPAPTEAVAATAEPTEVPLAEATEAPAAEATTAPEPAEPVSMYSESPMLADMVAAGDLPPVDERLPVDPKLINALPAEWLTPEVGVLGGVLRLAGPAVQYDNDGYMMHVQPLLNTPGIQGDNVTANVVKSYEVNADETEFVFTLREGLRWSDGVPVTTDDVRFAWDDVWHNEELSPAGLQAYMRTGSMSTGDPMELEIIDEYTFKCTFAGRYGGFPVALAIQGWRAYDVLLKPRHYLEQFHADYADADELQAMMDEGEFESWVQLFQHKDANSWAYMNARGLGMPKLTPWILAEASDEHCVLERNPYYFKVDAGGQQLPYFDRIDYTTVLDNEVLAVKQFAGEVDYGVETVDGPKLALYKENEDNGDYNTITTTNIHRTSGVAFLNLTFADEAWRKVVQNVEFRKALSVAIDRVEVIDAVYYGLGQPSHLNPNEYDPDLANQLLDDIGMDQRDANGWRLDPEGNPFVIEFQVRTDFYDCMPTAELYTEYWKAVGVNTTLKAVDPSLEGQLVTANEVKATDLFDVSTLWYYQSYGWGRWDTLWNLWWGSAGEDGEEPPQWYKDFRTLVETIMSVSPEEGRWEVTPACEQIVYDQVCYFVPTVFQKQLRIENKKMGNTTTHEEAFSIAQTLSMEQCYFKA